MPKIPPVKDFNQTPLFIVGWYYVLEASCIKKNIYWTVLGKIFYAHLPRPPAPDAQVWPRKIHERAIQARPNLYSLMIYPWRLFCININKVTEYILRKWLTKSKIGSFFDKNGRHFEKKTMIERFKPNQT
jgi:hypothetical protein